MTNKRRRRRNAVINKKENLLTKYIGSNERRRKIYIYSRFDACFNIFHSCFTSLKNSISFTALQDRAVTIILYFDNSKNIGIKETIQKKKEIMFL